MELNWVMKMDQLMLNLWLETRQGKRFLEFDTKKEVFLLSQKGKNWFKTPGGERWLWETHQGLAYIKMCGKRREVVLQRQEEAKRIAEAEKARKAQEKADREERESMKRRAEEEAQRRMREEEKAAGARTEPWRDDPATF